ncbi:polysaccharide deacetylase family protein [Corynebacterium diphtheriae]|nr:polysaccharide deacetylase family protein [Corynebacterium diphtheriae]
MDADKPRPADVAAKYDSAEPRAWGYDLPGIVKALDPSSTSIALTFDACGGPHGSLIDDPLLALLEQQAVPATLFWNKRWIEQNPQRALHLAQNPLFQIENHGTLHKPLSVNGRAAYGIPGTESAAELVEEIEGNRRFLREFLDVESNWFRSGTAFYDDVAVDIARELGVSLPGTAVASHLRQAAPGAIVLMHMNQPGRGTADGVREAIPQLREAGFTFAKLGEAPVYGECGPWALQKGVASAFHFCGTVAGFAFGPVADYVVAVAG